jgi:hypothetical protein
LARRADANPLALGDPIRSRSNGQSGFKNDPGPVTATVTTTMGRDENKRLRVAGMAVEVRLGATAERLEHLDRVLGQFEDFCVVTQSVRGGFPVEVSVRDGAGKLLKG